MTFLGILAIIWSFIKKHWKAIVVGLAILILLSYVAGFSTCGKPRIDQESIQIINNANEEKRKEELEKKVNENLDVIKSADKNTELSNLEIEERQKEIDKKVEELDKKVEEAKRNGKDITQEQLECMLVPENCQ